MQYGRHIYSESYVHNVKYMSTNSCSDTVYCIEFILGIYVTGTEIGI